MAKAMACLLWAFLVLLSSCVWAGESVAMIAARIDLACVDIKPVGVCRRKTPPYVGVKMRFWQPVLLVETLKRPGQCGITEFAPLVSALAMPGQEKEALFGGASQSDTTALQGNEAHVFGFPLADAVSVGMEAPCEGPPDLGGLISYLSEQDRQEWRQARRESQDPMVIMTQRSGALCDRFGPLLPGLCVGVWGALYPRTGYSTHASEIVASALTAFRAVDIAALKPITPHRVITPILFWPSVRHDRMQMVSPVKGRCMAIGEDPMLWDRQMRSYDGRYVWAYWRKKECCLF